MGTTIGLIKGDTRSLDYSSYKGYSELQLRLWPRSLFCVLTCARLSLCTLEAKASVLDLNPKP